MRASRSFTDTGHDLQPVLAQYWWVLFLRGALAVAFGVVTLAWPDLSFAVTLVFVGTWLLADGVVASLQAFTSTHRWPHFLDGALSLLAAAIVLFYPGIGGLALMETIAWWLIAKGIVQVLITLRFGGTHTAARLLGVLGVATTGFGVFLAHDPTDAMGMMRVIAGFAVLLGLSFVALGWWFER
jgi:uncharacterized membrane protein HdeD (DUF308 family)